MIWGKYNGKYMTAAFRHKTHYFLKVIILFAVAILVSSPVISADMSNWSDKTICRLANEKNSRSRIEFINEVVSRGLGCITDNKLKKTPSKNIPTVNKSVVSKNIEDTNGADAYKVFKSNFRSSIPECKGNSTLSKLFKAPFSSWDNCWGDISFKMFTNISKERKKDEYIGEWKSGRFHGNGAYLYQSDTHKKNNLYIGEFYQDMESGRGKYYLFNSKDKKYYDGHFLKNMFHGIGTLYFRNGTKYDGNWIRGRKNGYFKYTGIDGVSKKQYYKMGLISKTPEQIAVEQKIVEDQLKSELALKLEALKESTLADLAKTKGFFESDLFNEGFELYKVPQDHLQGSRVIIDVKGTVSVISDKLASGVRTSSSTTKTSSACPENLGACTNEFVCRRGIALIAGEKFWHLGSDSFYKYSVEAKKRGLSCGVGTGSSTTSSAGNGIGSMSGTHYKSALANSKHGRIIIVSVGSISLKDEVKEIITRKKKYKSGTKEIPNTLYFEKVQKLNALYVKLGKRNNSKSRIEKQYNTYCSSDTMTGLNCSTQPDYGSNARAEIASSAIGFFIDALDGVHARKAEVRKLEKSLDQMSPLKNVTTFSDHTVKISSSRSDVDYRVDITYLDLKSNNYEVYSKIYSSPIYASKIMNKNSSMASLEQEMLRDYMKNKDAKIVRLRVVPEDIIQSSTGSYINSITNIDSLFAQILSTEMLDNRVLDRETTKDKVLKISSGSSEPIKVKSNNYYALIANNKFISWCEGDNVRKVLLQGMLEGNQSATDSLIKSWNNHITQD